MISSRLRSCIVLAAAFLMFAGVSTAQTGSATSGGSNIKGELDALAGGSLWGGDYGYCDNPSSGETCTKGNNTWKINVEGAVLFSLGSGRFSVGPVFGVAYRGSVPHMLTYTGEGSETYNYEDRINSLFVGGRVSVKLADKLQLFVEAGPSVNTDRYQDNYVSGTYFDHYLSNTTLTAPEEGVGLTYFASKHVGFTVKYERQDIRAYREVESEGDDPYQYDTVIHENGIVGGLTLWIGGR